MQYLVTDSTGEYLTWEMPWPDLFTGGKLLEEAEDDVEPKFELVSFVIDSCPLTSPLRSRPVSIISALFNASTNHVSVFGWVSTGLDSSLPSQSVSATALHRARPPWLVFEGKRNNRMRVFGTVDDDSHVRYPCSSIMIWTSSSVAMEMRESSSWSGSWYFTLKS